MIPAPALRRAAVGDAAKLALIGAATFLHAFAHDHPGDDLVAHCGALHGEEPYARWLADPAHAFWLMETPLGAPVGYAMLSPPALDCPTAPDDLELKRIYMLGPWQGGGRGVALLDAVLEEARARAAARLLLCVYEANTRAQEFYARHGFARIGTQRFMVGATAFTDFILARGLG